MGLLIEGANARHGHEWEVFATHRLPDDKVLVPGVLDSTSNIVEHPQLVAQRIVQYAELVGKERVIAGTDCGFGTFAGFGAVHPSICWAKMKSLAMVPESRAPACGARAETLNLDQIVAIDIHTHVHGSVCGDTDSERLQAMGQY